MLKAILVTKATLAARTPAPPLMPQNQGMGLVVIVETNRMPVGNPKPIRKPAGARTRTQRPAANKKACRPGIDQAHLDDIERTWCPCKLTARLVDLELHPIQYRDCCIEPISKSSEEDNEAGELDKAEEVLSVVLPADEDATLPLYPGEEPLDEPSPRVTA